MKRSKTRISSMITGVIVAVAIIVSQGFSLGSSDDFKTAVEHEQSSSDADEGCGGNPVNFILSTSSLPSSVQVHLTQATFFLFEILFEKTEATDSFLVPSLPVNQFFRVLLGVTIAPNAP